VIALAATVDAGLGFIRGAGLPNNEIRFGMPTLRTLYARLGQSRGIFAYHRHLFVFGVSHKGLFLLSDFHGLTA